MKIQKTQTVAYEAAKNYDRNSNSLLMLGTEALYDDFPELESGGIDSAHNSFISIYDLDHSFYYRIDRLSDKESVANEVGIGNLMEHEGNIILVRSQPMYVTPKGEERMCAYGCNPLDFSHVRETIMVTSYIPTNIVEALPDPNMIITSLDDHLPHPLKVEKNSVIGRLEGTIESVSLDDLSQLVRGGSVVAPPLTFETKPELGTIVFDMDSACLCFWNGNDWRQLMEMDS